MLLDVLEFRYRDNEQENPTAPPERKEDAMKKRIVGLDEKLQTINEEDPGKDDMVTRRQVLQMIGNAKADSADNARRTRRLINTLRDKTSSEIELESDDLSFVIREIERNAIGLTAWAQGQVLDMLESAEKVPLTSGMALPS